MSVVEETVAEEANGEEAVAEEAANEEVVVEPAEEETTATDGGAESISETEPEPVADIGPPPEFSPNLRASNPDNVVIGNGKPQVIEFFAFW